jgi:Tfp pilus assembly protein PilN
LHSVLTTRHHGGNGMPFAVIEGVDEHLLKVLVAALVGAYPLLFRLFFKHEAALRKQHAKALQKKQRLLDAQIDELAKLRVYKETHEAALQKAAEKHRRNRGEEQP